MPAAVDIDADNVLLRLLLTPEGRVDPYTHYRQLRDTVHVLRSSFGPIVLCRYDDCITALRDPRLGRGTALGAAGGVPLCFAGFDRDPSCGMHSSTGPETTGGANGAPAHFAHAETLDLGRADDTPLRFGWGIHHCLGAALARMEGELVFNALLARCRTIDTRFDEPEWRPTLTLRGLADLPVEVAA